MQQAVIRAYLDEPVATIDPRIYSGFIEHLRRGIYGGVYEPTHATANADGFRTDVTDARSLNIPLIRYPGGNFVSSYIWEEGVGPTEDRPVRLDLAWRSLEPNLVGTNELMNWLDLVQAPGYVGRKPGIRGLDAACNC